MPPLNTILTVSALHPNEGASLHTLSELIPASLVYAMFGSVMTAAAIVIFWYARRDRNAVDNRLTATEESMSKMRDEDVPHLHGRVTKLDADMRDFKFHVAENYVSQPMLGKYVTEPLRRIEEKLDAHILQKNGNGKDAAKP